MSELPDLKIDVQFAAADWQNTLPDAENFCRAAVIAAWQGASTNVTRAIAGHSVEVSLYLTGDNEVVALNSTFRKRAAATNVLSFPGMVEEDFSVLPDDAPVLLGDVVIAFGVTERESRKQNKSLANHLSHLVVHGRLHLLGYDHIGEDGAEVMERLETMGLADLAIVDPYVDDNAAT